jgi:hypothetical protein
MANDVMIDMETLSTSPNCVILTIGAVRFDPRGEGVVERLELRPTIEEQTEEFNRSYRSRHCSMVGTAIRECDGRSTR